MKFSFNGRNFRLGFERHFRQVTVYSRGQHHTIKSKYPYTTATLYEVRDNNTPRIVAHDTVGCLHTDNYSNANGRLWALRALNGTLKRLTEFGDKEGNKAFRTALWQAYRDRDKPKAIETTATKVEDTPLSDWRKALPPARSEGDTLADRIIH